MVSHTAFGKAEPRHPNEISVHLRCEKNGLGPCQPPTPQLAQQEFAVSPVFQSGWSINIDSAMFSFRFYFMQSHWEWSEQPDMRKAIQLVKMDCGVCRLSNPDVELLLWC